MTFDLERQIAGAVRSSKRLWFVNLLGHALLGFLAYEWLWIPDSTVGYVALSGVTALAIVFLTLWLHGATLRYFHAIHAGEERPQVVWSTVRRLPALAVCAIVVVATSNLILLLLDYHDPVANSIASWLTLNFRRPISPETIGAIFGCLVWVGGHFKALLLLLPWAESAATHGFGAFSLKHIFTPLRTALHPRYWLTLVGVFGLGVLIPAILVQWSPGLSNIPLETASMLVRFGAAYVCAATAWLLLASAVTAWSVRRRKTA